MNAKLAVQCTTMCYMLSPIIIRIVKLFVIITVDGGPDKNPCYPKTLNAAYKTFKDHNLDALFTACNAPSHSAYNAVERRMAPLSPDLTWFYSSS